ncbi:gonadotropin-releasing hormone receptor [Stegastes partitus]|uniref:Gonadotropin-releasing hormone receptor n=1 Tax=Stegastes partitus TaxID=144197 RepID=A0A9Y4K724_9TELE|nr:PREDICTED: gonadotropin-releasing hormone receptor-like [Stegastes partitus]
MADFPVDLLSLRIVVSCIGLVGNVFLIMSILQTRFSRVKSFELFLLGLAAANLEEIIIINIYDVTILSMSSPLVGTWSCRLLRFLTVLGEISSILFTVLISVFRYQKLRDADRRVNLPIYLDSIRSAWIMSGVCVMLSVLLGLPTVVMDLQGSVGNNVSGNSSGCPPDFFQCSKTSCPLLNRLYKYVFTLVCYMLPLIIVTATGSLILAVLLKRRKMVTPTVSVSWSNQLSTKIKNPKLQRSTVAVLAAMVLFQVDWTIYLIFLWMFSSGDSRLWAEIEFFISTSYTSMSPYVYGVGNNLFSLKNCKSK